MNRLWNRLAVDLRYALRSLRSGRSATLVPLVVLTLAMAAATVTFSVVDAVALRPLPYGSPDRLVSVRVPGPSPDQPYPPRLQDYLAWRDETQAFESMAAVRTGVGGPLRLTTPSGVETLRTVQITPNLFDVLDVRPALGRFFGPEHEVPGGPEGAILSHEVWVRRFGADPEIIGRRIAFQNGTREVTGVLPENVSYPITSGPDTDVYVPYVLSEQDRRPDVPLRGFVSVVARLSPGVTLEAAAADASRVSPALLTPLHELVVGPSGRWLVLVLVAVGIVLLVACANVGTVLLARALTRLGEFATREALGASRARLTTGLLAEGVILSLTAAAGAVLLSSWGVDLARANLPPGLTRVSTIAVDVRVLVTSITAAVICGLLFSAAPAWLVAGTNLMASIRDGESAVAGGPRRDRVLAGFLVANVSFVCVLLVCAALVLATYVAVTTKDLGYDRRHVVLLSFMRSLSDLPAADRPAAAAALRAEAVERTRAVPGVSAIAFAQNATAPMSPGSVRYGLTIPGVGEVTGSDMLETNMVSPSYFDVMGMELLRGRGFDTGDGRGAPRVMIINDAAAQRYFPGRDPVGQVVTFRGATTIVGVVRGVYYDGPESAVRPAMYIPFEQEPFVGDFAMGTLFVRTAADPRRHASALTDAVRPIVGDRLELRFLDDYFRRATAARRFNAAVMGAFGILAIVIGTIGVYGTMAFVVARQVRTIGVRMALGASPTVILRGVLGNALKWVTLGTAVGLTVAWTTSNALRSFVFGVRTTEPMVYLAVACLLVVVGLCAALIPAVRAAKLDPLIALRRD